MPDTSTPARRNPPAPRTGWWWLALALTGLMVLVLAVTVAVSVSNTMAAEARRANGTTPTTAKSAGQSPAPVQDWGVPSDPNLPLDEEQAAARVRAFFADFGKAVRDPNGEPDELFTWTEMSEVVPDDAVENQVGQLVDSISACRQVVQAEVNVWRQWDWAKVDVRKVIRRPDGAALEAIVWHLTRDGKRVKRRWTFTGGDGGVGQILGWEDLHTGVTARDRAYALAAASLSPSIRRQRQWQLNQVPEIHRLIDQRKWDEARTRLDRIRTVRFEGELSYSVELAEARLAFRDRTSDDGEWDQELAIEILDELIARHPERLAAYPILAEVSLESEEYARVIEVCAAYMAVTGDDPDALALRGAAKLALVQTDEAAADFQAALALDKYQPRAVNWQRQRADERGKKAVANTLATAPDPADLFDALVEWAVPEADWPGVLALAERYRQLRPKEARWVSPLIDALLRLNRTDDAIKVLKEALPTIPAVDRPAVVQRFAGTMIVLQLTDRVYPAVPPADAPAAFRPLAEHYEMMRERWITRPSDEGKERRDAATKALTDLIAAHRKAHPDDPWLALHDGRLKYDSGNHAAAAAAVAPALAKLTLTGDPIKDWRSGYSQLRNELIDARYKSGKGAEAYRELKHDRDVFNRIADLCLTDKNATALAALLDERKAAGVEAVDELFWRAEVDRVAGRHADAAAKYQRYIAADGAEQLYLGSARASRLRCLVRAGESATALQDIRSAPVGAFSLDVRALVLAKMGRPADAEQLLRSLLAQHGWTGGLYADEDLGPILKGDPAFAVFRKDHPPPTDKPAPPR